MITDFRLQVFVSVARTMSFTRAATELNVSQPAVTRHIRELESAVGQPLFERHGSSISLTAYALELLSLVHRVLDGYDRLNEACHASNHSFEGTLHMGASTTIAQYVLPVHLARFRGRYPNVGIQLSSGNSSDMTEEVVSRRLDCALVEGNDTHPALHYQPFADDRIVLVAARRVPGAISFEALQRLPLVIRESGSGTLAVVEQALAAHGIRRTDLNVVMQLGSSEGIVRYLFESGSYAFLSVAALGEYLDDKRLHVVNVEGLNIRRTFRFVTLHGQSNRLVELFREFCKSDS